MNTVLVTGAGDPSGIAVIRALVERGDEVVAVDTDPLAAGLHLATRHEVLAAANEPDCFIRTIAEIVTTHSIDLVVPTVSEEMLLLAGREHELGAPAWLPNRRSVAACVDKWRFWKVAERALVPAAPSVLGSEPLESIVDALPAPWIVKPRFRTGSRDVYAVDDPAELAWACRRVDEPIVQTRLDGGEFTVDLLIDHDGQISGAVPRWRLDTHAGISMKGRTFRDARLVKVAERIVEIFGITGAANLQGFVTDDNEIVVIEVNPHFSEGLALSLAAGADLLGEFVRGALGEPIRAERLSFRDGVTMVRHYTELFAA